MTSVFNNISLLYSPKESLSSWIRASIPISSSEKLECSAPVSSTIPVFSGNIPFRRETILFILDISAFKIMPPTLFSLIRPIHVSSILHSDIVDWNLWQLFSFHKCFFFCLDRACCWPPGRVCKPLSGKGLRLYSSTFCVDQLVIFAQLMVVICRCRIFAYSIEDSICLSEKSDRHHIRFARLIANPQSRRMLLQQRDFQFG